METLEKPISKAEQGRREKEEAIEQLRKWMPAGSTVYTILRHVSRSGMQREISVVVFQDGQPIHPNWSVAKALGWRLNKGGMNDALIVGGCCGMDMGFHLVYTLSQVLYGKGGELKQQWL